MGKLWAGRFEKELDKEADDFNSSLYFDKRMYKQDIKGSMAHAEMLASCGILTAEESKAIITGLDEILHGIEDGSVEVLEGEDIHMFVEALLTEKIGDIGKKLHTARSRNDQVALDLRLYLRDETENVIGLIKALLGAIVSQAEKNKGSIMPGYTHLQRAQPITFAHHLLAYAMMLMRDISRLRDASARMNMNPLGSCALAGTTYPTDRYQTASLLGFDGICENSIDGVSDRDFCVELMSAFALIMAHLSRFAEEIILWSSWEFKFIELDDSYTTGSSIMPQKKNPDMAELVRGKTGRVYGDLFALLTALKGIPLAYNKDMQEDKEAVFDSLDTVKKCLGIFAPMVDSFRTIPENMYAAAQTGFINATDLADYLVKKGMPFRDAYKITGRLVAYCTSKQTVLSELPLEEYKSFSELFDEELYGEISLEACVERRISAGGTGKASVERQIAIVKKFIEGKAE